MTEKQGCRRLRLRGNTPNLLNLLVRTIVGSCRIEITMPQFSSEDEDCGIFMQERYPDLRCWSGKEEKSTKQVLTMAGSDCSGGAGVQADLKTMAAHGVFGMSVIVSVVAENTARVIDIQDISPRMIEEQIDAVFEDIAPDAVKIGMLSSPECMKAVADKLRQYRPANVVIDPVMFAKNGDPLMDPKSVGALIETVLPFADVLTPNVPEAQYLAGMEIHTPADMETAARKIGALGCKNVLVKGGKNIPGAVDVLFDGETCHRIEIEQVDSTSTHGTGCTLSSAIASNLALGKSVPEAVRLAKEYVTDAIRHAPGLGHGCGPLDHFCRIFNRSESK